jgi:hypothetical protein
MSSDASSEDPRTRTGILRAEFGESWRVWAWSRRQFTPTSLGAIGVILAASGGYIAHLSQRVSDQALRIQIVETRVIPVLEERKDELTNHADIAALERRISTLEDRLNYATKEAGSPPVPIRRRKTTR